MKVALAIAAAGMAVGLISFSGSASAAPVGPSAVLTQAGSSLHVEARMRRPAAKSTRGMRKLPRKKGL